MQRGLELTVKYQNKGQICRRHKSTFLHGLSGFMPTYTSQESGSLPLDEQQIEHQAGG